MADLTIVYEQVVTASRLCIFHLLITDNCHSKLST